MKINYDEFGNRYYSVPKEFVSSGKEIKVYMPYGAKVPYPYSVSVGSINDIESMIALSPEGIKELIEALVRVL